MNTTGKLSSPVTETIWYSYSGRKYEGKFPGFFNPEDIPGLNEVAEQIDSIRKEILSKVTDPGTMQPYFNASMVAGEGSWDVLHLIQWGRPNTGAIADLSVTANAMKSIPGLLSLGIAKLSANTEIKPHIGDTNAVIRCHLGIQIPAGLPECGIEVNNETRAWEEGKWIAFCDAHEHRTWNNTSTERYVVIADILYDSFKSEKEEICRNVLSYHMLQHKLQKYPWMKMLPGPLLGLLRRTYKNKV